MTTTPQEPSDEELNDLSEELEQETFPPAEADPLEDLYAEAASARKLRKPAPRTDSAMRNALDATAKRMKETYSNPENWKRTRGLLLIDRATHTVLGNYSEFVHRQFPTTRKFLHEHSPIAIDSQEEIEGFLGVELERRVRGVSWDSEQIITLHVLLDESFAEAPDVQLKVCLQLSSVVRVELAADTQLANPAGSLLLKLPAGTDIWAACSTDTKAAIRRAAL